MVSNLDDFSSKNINQNSTNSDAFGLLNKYKNFSKDELINEFIRQANDQKSKGTFDKNKIQNIAQTILPLLNSDQRRIINELLDKV